MTINILCLHGMHMNSETLVSHMGPPGLRDLINDVKMNNQIDVRFHFVVGPFETTEQDYADMMKSYPLTQADVDEMKNTGPNYHWGLNNLNEDRWVKIKETVDNYVEANLTPNNEQVDMLLGYSEGAQAALGLLLQTPDYLGIGKAILIHGRCHTDFECFDNHLHNQLGGCFVTERQKNYKGDLCHVADPKHDELLEWVRVEKHIPCIFYCSNKEHFNFHLDQEVRKGIAEYIYKSNTYRL